MAAGEKPPIIPSIREPFWYKDRSVVSFFEDEIIALTQPFKHSMVGKFSRMPRLNEIRIVFKGIGLVGAYEIHWLDYKHILIHFSKDHDLNRLWMRQAWAQRFNMLGDGTQDGEIGLNKTEIPRERKKNRFNSNEALKIEYEWLVIGKAGKSGAKDSQGVEIVSKEGGNDLMKLSNRFGTFGALEVDEQIDHAKQARIERVNSTMLIPEKKFQIKKNSARKCETVGSLRASPTSHGKRGVIGTQVVRRNEGLPTTVIDEEFPTVVNFDKGSTHARAWDNAKNDYGSFVSMKILGTVTTSNGQWRMLDRTQSNGNEPFSAQVYQSVERVEGSGEHIPELGAELSQDGFCKLAASTAACTHGMMEKTNHAELEVHPMVLCRRKSNSAISVGHTISSSFNEAVGEEGKDGMQDNDSISREERLYGAIPYEGSMEDFVAALLDCGLVDRGFESNPYTWTNSHMFQRLDRVVYNHQWLEYLTITRVQHLNRDGSDHCLLLVSCSKSLEKSPSSFRFLHAWVQHHDFKKFVEANWKLPIHDKGMKAFWRKQLRLKHNLKWWNKAVFGDIFHNLKEVEKGAEVNELMFQQE
ncbi:Uncharacterized protein TCM_022291 [Theobroma cacao]|uniref:DUF4283 domain-containing protein n=1 Tax=Theobroma cacao TaxID=3641 RepID=A0A061ETG5_THECC|nr:Uncharacterized protein TCM_022291 [Theobroma cacao]